MAQPEFSSRTRQESLARFRSESFDLLVIGGGITGAATARDAASRGLRVALVERRDFAWGTSSRSSKLIHGGLRYLENFEFHLVFEALAERTLLLRTAPHMVRPLPFYWPVYEGDPHGQAALSAGLWLYDLLALFRAPGFHRRLSLQALRRDIPFLRAEGLKGGFRYFDASMWDDVLAVQTLQSASTMGAAIANYVEAVSPVWTDGRISGYRLRDLETGAELAVSATQTIVCAGPWTDELGRALSPEWRTWLNPSKGVHLVFDLKRIPIPGAMVMANPADGRISFVIPRPDYGAGVVIVGTTDGPTPADPTQASIEKADVEYLMTLLNRYFPDLKLTDSDILSAYVGVRPLFATGQGQALQKVSREHHIGAGPGGTVIVAGGKYTTHRKMAEEIVDYALSHWPAGPRPKAGKSRTRAPVNPAAAPEALRALEGARLPAPLVGRYGTDARAIAGEPSVDPDPEGFPNLEAQLRYCMRSEMALHLEDFFFRRVPLYASRADHGARWARRLSQVWCEERGLPAEAGAAELARLEAEIERRSRWKSGLRSATI